MKLMEYFFKVDQATLLLRVKGGRVVIRKAHSVFYFTDARWREIGHWNKLQ